jgi:hypothetical protein
MTAQISLLTSESRLSAPLPNKDPLFVKIY